MINIRPVSDLRNKFTELENQITNTNSPIFLTKNGYGTMVLMSVEQYSALTDNVELKLDEADIVAKNTNIRYTKDEIFNKAKERINGR